MSCEACQPLLVPKVYKLPYSDENHLQPFLNSWHDIFQYHIQSIACCLGLLRISPVADSFFWHIVQITRPKDLVIDRKSTRLNSSHVKISYAVFCLKKKIYT